MSDITRHLWNDSSHDIRELFRKSGYRVSSADVGRHFTEALHDIRVGGYDSGSPLWIFLQGFGDGIFDDSHFRTIQMGIDINPNHRDFSDDDGSSSINIFHASCQLDETIRSCLRGLIIGRLRSRLLNALCLRNLLIGLWRSLIGRRFIP